MGFASFVTNLVGARGHAPPPGRRRARSIGIRDEPAVDIAAIVSRMQMIEVASSNLLAVGYDPVENRLFVTFKAKSSRRGGSYPSLTYEYFDVPQAIYDGLMSAPSKGQYFWTHIRGRKLPGPYQYRKVSVSGVATAKRAFKTEPEEARQPGGYSDRFLGTRPLVDTGGNEPISSPRGRGTLSRLGRLLGWGR